MPSASLFFGSFFSLNYHNKGSIMIGYKATDANMKGRGYQFIMNEVHVHTGNIVPYTSGFHFCPEVHDVFNYYHNPDFLKYMHVVMSL